MIFSFRIVPVLSHLEEGLEKRVRLVLTEKHLWLHHHAMLSLVVVLKKTLSDSRQRFSCFTHESSSDSPRETSCSSPLSGQSLSKVDVLRSSRNLECSIRDWEYEIVTFHRREHFLCIEPSGVPDSSPHTRHDRRICLEGHWGRIDEVSVGLSQK